MANQFKVQVLNQISQLGLKRLPSEGYSVAKEVEQPDVILVRSANMHSMEIPASVKAVGRAGAGTNNIPIKDLSARGVPVFNTPGANANAVKELVIAGTSRGQSFTLPPSTVTTRPLRRRWRTAKSSSPVASLPAIPSG
jgi:D-3-phosphoglycerate dehydrogenase